MPEAQAFLSVAGLTAFYGETQALHGVDLEVRRGEVVCLLGRNGAGKTTTLRAVMGLIDKRGGDIRIDGRATRGLQPEALAHLGVAYCPEERGIFASLDVEENLMLPPVLLPGGMSVDEISEGLAPVIVQKLAETIRTLKAKGYTIVLVEQNFRFAAPLADRFYVMEHGKIVRQFAQHELAANTAMLQEYLGV